MASEGLAVGEEISIVGIAVFVGKVLVGELGVMATVSEISAEADVAVSLGSSSTDERVGTQLVANIARMIKVFLCFIMVSDSGFVVLGLRH